MQLKRLYIKDYKILKGFNYEFPFDFKHYANVLIGVNGSGKSTILEVIAEIFSCAYLSKKAKFGFELEYSVHLKELEDVQLKDTEFFTKNLFVKLSAKKANDTINVLIHNDRKRVIFDNKILEKGKNIISIPFQNSYKDLSIFPDNVVVYYAGLSKILERLCQPHNDLLSKKYRKGVTDKKIDFYYHKPELFGSILMSLLSYEYGDVPKFLTEKTKISGIQLIQIRLRKPSWANDTIEKFWGADGKIKNVLTYLKDKSRIDSSLYFVYEKEEFIIITISKKETLFEIREHLVEEKALFKILYTMYLDDMLDNISFSLYKEEDGKSETFSILSEGEQQAITIKGLTELLAEENTLFLFDEPDTYLHPKWQRQFITEIEESIEQNLKNEITYLIATHSPQILSNAKPEKTYVKIIEDGKLIEITPKHYGREISSILYNLMGVEERNKTIRNDLSNLFTLIEDEEIEDAEIELQRLIEILGETDPDIKNAAIQIEYLKEDETGN